MESFEWEMEGIIQSNLQPNAITLGSYFWDHSHSEMSHKHRFIFHWLLIYHYLNVKRNKNKKQIHKFLLINVQQMFKKTTPFQVCSENNRIITSQVHCSVIFVHNIGHPYISLQPLTFLSVGAYEKSGVPATRRIASLHFGWFNRCKG